MSGAVLSPADTALLLIQNAIAKSYTTILGDCGADTYANQTIQLGCFPPVTDGVPYESNSVCTLCITTVYEQYMANHDLLKVSNQLIDTAPSLNEEMGSFVASMSGCAQVCKACSMKNINQFNTINIRTSCLNNMYDTSKLSQALVDSLKDLIAQNTDLMNRLSAAKNYPNGDIATSMQSEIMTQLTRSFHDSLYASIIASQNIIIVASSVQAMHISQDSVFQLVVSQLTQRGVGQQIINESVRAKLNASKEQDLQAAQNSVNIQLVSNTLIALLNQTSFQLMMGSIYLLGGLLVTIIVFILYDWYRHLVNPVHS